MFSASRTLRLNTIGNEIQRLPRLRLLHTTQALAQQQQQQQKQQCRIAIRTSQPLQKLAERRCLLTALQRFGEVASFTAVTKDNDSDCNILAIYDTPEAARKAINASPLTVLLPAHAHTHAHAHATLERNGGQYIQCDIIEQCEQTDRDGGLNHEEEEQEQDTRDQTSTNTHNDWQSVWNSKNNDTTTPRRDPRIADVIAAGIPRREFADCLLIDQDNSQVETARGNKRDIHTKERDEKAELVAKGSLIALMET